MDFMKHIKILHQVEMVLNSAGVRRKDLGREDDEIRGISNKVQSGFGRFGTIQYASFPEDCVCMRKLLLINIWAVSHF